MPEKFKITGANMFTAVNGDFNLVFSVPKHLAEQAQNAVLTAQKRLKNGKYVAITIAEVKQKRSLDENAYFHVLVDRIAQTLGIGADEVKDDLVINYGVALFVCTVPQDVNIKSRWRYARYIGDKDGKAEYMLYKETHEMDTAEMARLISGARHEAQQLGIAVETPQELAQLLGEKK